MSHSLTTCATRTYYMGIGKGGIGASAPAALSKVGGTNGFMPPPPPWKDQVF